MAGLFSYWHDDPSSWYVSPFELFSIAHLTNIGRAFLIYDVMLPFVFLVQIKHWPKLVKQNNTFLLLMSVFLLIAFSLKRHVLGFFDWDLFSWAVIVWNITLIPLIQKIYSQRLLWFRLVILGCVWFIFNKPSASFDLLPEGSRNLAINNRHPSRPIPDVGPMVDIRRDLRELKKQRSLTNPASSKE